MTEGKLGLGMGEQDKRVEELEKKLANKEATIQDLRKEIERLESNLSYAYRYICLLKGDHYG